MRLPGVFRVVRRLGVTIADSFLRQRGEVAVDALGAAAVCGPAGTARLSRARR